LLLPVPRRVLVIEGAPRVKFGIIRGRYDGLGLDAAIRELEPLTHYGAVHIPGVGWRFLPPGTLDP
jgi:hypothetical protein